jgi:hypothetical protein
MIGAFLNVGVPMFNNPPKGRKVYDLITQAAMQHADYENMSKIYNGDGDAIMRWQAFERAVFDFCKWAGDKQ